MNEFYIQLPTSDEEIRELSIGDVVYLTGTIITARDHAHKRIIEYHRKGKSLPKELENKDNLAIYHCGPVILDDEGNSGSYKLYSGGPTTSARMVPFQLDACNILGIKIVIGKGGMEGTDFETLGGVYLSYTGGCGAIFARYVKTIKDVIWPDLGMPEAIWIFEVEKFGPLIVSQDSKGNNLYGFAG